MADSVQVAAYEGGELRVLASGEKSSEAVLALPLSRLVAKVVRVPADDAGDPVKFATPLLQAMSPYPDEPLTVSCEALSDTERGTVVLAAALPESAADDIAEALDARRLNVTRIDALALGELRSAWGALGAADGARRMAIVGGKDCLSAIVLDGETPSAVRAFPAASDLRRELTLSLLEAEDFGGAKPLKEIVAIGEAGPLDALAAFAPVRRVDAPEDAALAGVRERSAEAGALNALPASWREVLEETRFKAKMRRFLVVALGLWAVAVAAMFGVPVAYGLMTDHQKTLSREHSRAYRSVAEMRDKVRLVQKYSDHARGALEIMKAVSDRLPQGVTLTSWNYKRDEGVKVSGEADDAEGVYNFKDNMAEAGGEDDGEAVFGTVNLNGPSAARGGKQKFDLDCRYLSEEDE